jgi:hypothetical protein
VKKIYLQFQADLSNAIKQALRFDTSDVNSIVDSVLEAYVSKDFAVNKCYGKLPLTNNDNETLRILAGFKARIGKLPRGTWAVFNKTNSPEKVYCALISDGAGGNAIKLDSDATDYSAIHKLLLKKEIESLYAKINKCKLADDIGLATLKKKETTDTEVTRNNGESHVIRNVTPRYLESTRHVVGGIR